MIEQADMDKLQFATKVNTIPCFCRVDYYIPGHPDKVTGPMEDAEEGYDEEFGYTILDSRHIKAPWIDKQMNKADEERLIEEYMITLLAIKHYYEDP